MNGMHITLLNGIEKALPASPAGLTSQEEHLADGMIQQ
jgi:hypothetical protein